MRVYLDHNATTPLHPDVLRAVVAGLGDAWGNPSSIHAEGRATRERVEAARREVAALVGGDPSEIVFTSGGTEADALGIIGLARAVGDGTLIAAADIEHPAVHGAIAASGGAARALRVDAAGRVDPADVEAACEQGAQVIAVALANHELGTIQDVAAIAACARAAGAMVHCDAVQAAGKVAIDVGALGVDSLAISAHKMYGPKGVGALWVRSGIDLASLIGGGHQERERRAGTENVPGIIGFGAAARIARLDGLAAQPMVAALRDRLEQALVAMPRVRVHGGGAERVSNTLNVGFDGALGEAVVQALDLEGVAASTGAACTSGSVEPSPVLLALGVSANVAAEAVRFSLGVGTTDDDIDKVVEILPMIVERARKHRG